MSGSGFVGLRKRTLGTTSGGCGPFDFADGTTLGNGAANALFINGKFDDSAGPNCSGPVGVEDCIKIWGNKKLGDFTCNVSGPWGGTSNFMCGSSCTVSTTGFTPTSYVGSLDYKYYYQTVKLTPLTLTHNSNCKICYSFAIVALDGGNLSKVSASLIPDNRNPTHISFEATNTDQKDFSFKMTVTANSVNESTTYVLTRKVLVCWLPVWTLAPT